MTRPALVVVYDDREVLAALEQALRGRFGTDYQIVAADTPVAALDVLGRLGQAGELVALVLADQWLAGMTGVQFLCRAHELHPTAKRVLFMTYGDAAAGTAGCRRWRWGSSTTISTRRGGRPSCSYTRRSPRRSASGPKSPAALTLADGGQAVSRAVVIATGVSYRRLPVPGLEALLGAGVFYGAAVTEAKAMAGQRVAVVGGANSAGQAAVHLARHAEQVTLLVRGDALPDGMSAYLVQELQRAGNITVRLRTEVTEVHGAGRLETLAIRERAAETLSAAALFIMIGAEPHTDWLAATVERDDRGFLLTGRDLLRDGRPPPAWPLDRQPLLLETSLPGVFAAGDIRHGSVKRVASAVGEGAIAIQLIHTYLNDVAPAIR
jgi:thioredoxin reductase/CheY-like chemotaxis protein